MSLAYRDRQIIRPWGKPPFIKLGGGHVRVYVLLVYRRQARWFIKLPRQAREERREKDGGKDLLGAKRGQARRCGAARHHRRTFALESKTKLLKFVIRACTFDVYARSRRLYEFPVNMAASSVEADEKRLVYSLADLRNTMRCCKTRERETST